MKRVKEFIHAASRACIAIWRVRSGSICNQAWDIKTTQYIPIVNRKYDSPPPSGSSLVSDPVLPLGHTEQCLRR